MNECKKCGSRFADDEVAQTWAAEYPGGKSWPYDVSPCCAAAFVEIEADSKVA